MTLVMAMLPLEDVDAEMPIDALPKAPRPLTPRARQRAWQEPIVRFLWLSAIGISVVALYFLLWLERNDICVDRRSFRPVSFGSCGRDSV